MYNTKQCYRVNVAMLYIVPLEKGAGGHSIRGT